MAQIIKFPTRTNLHRVVLRDVEKSFALDFVSSQQSYIRTENPYYERNQSYSNVRSANRKSGIG